MSEKAHEEDVHVQAVKRRCEAWAEWYSRGQLCGLGYPSTSLEYRLLRGTWVKRGLGNSSMFYSAEAEETEAWIVEMATPYPRLARILRCYYLEAASLRQGARCLGMSHTYFRAQLTLAHHWLAGKLRLTCKKGPK